jgi:predicted Fe-Mo cluster-binding NifX family protein
LGEDSKRLDMRIAFATWNDRIAPLFDVTRRVHVVETDGPLVVRESEEALDDETAAGRAARLAALGVDALVCGAISRFQEALLQAYGVAVVPFVTGDLREVVVAWRARRLGGDAFAMPGCGRERGHGFRGGRGWGREARGRHRAGATRRRPVD